MLKFRLLLELMMEIQLNQQPPFPKKTKYQPSRLAQGILRMLARVHEKCSIYAMVFFLKK